MPRPLLVFVCYFAMSQYYIEWRLCLFRDYICGQCCRVLVIQLI